MLSGVDIELVVGVTYMSLQLLFLFVISILGYNYVSKKRRTITPWQNIVDPESGQKPHRPGPQEDAKNEENVSKKSADSGAPGANGTKQKKKEKSFCHEWIMTMWKMRSIYSSFIVPSFDITTDIYRNYSMVV